MGSIPLRTRYGIWPRPAYAYGVYAAALQAKALSMAEISVIEFGVAGGNGLLALEAMGKQIGAYLGVKIVAAGFDGGVGMPEPKDYRDLPHVWSAGDFKMDEAALRRRLDPATRLVIGDVADTTPVAMASLPPVGFAAFDLDFYTSTKDALAVLDGPSSGRLPRMYCYFDDTIFPEWACHNPDVGELRAIREFNEQHASIRLHRHEALRWSRPHREAWTDQVYVAHDFSHPQYPVNVARSHGSIMQRPLTSRRPKVGVA